MWKRRFRLSGLFAVLVALMAQLATGATVPRLDPIAMVALCHSDDGDAPARQPSHPADCQVCPLCAAIQGQPDVLAANMPGWPPPSVQSLARPQLPPPSTAPPARDRPPGQPRAPPSLS